MERSTPGRGECRRGWSTTRAASPRPTRSPRSPRRPARRGGFYASHIRNRDARLLDAVDEAIAIARDSGAGGQISHLNVRRNTGAVPHAWDQAVERIERARASGIDVMADATPFTFGLGLMVNLLPEWAAEGGPAATAAPARRPGRAGACPP